jgi:hypothetical protein
VQGYHPMMLDIAEQLRPQVGSPETPDDEIDVTHGT